MASRAQVQPHGHSWNLCGFIALPSHHIYLSLPIPPPLLLAPVFDVVVNSDLLRQATTFRPLKYFLVQLAMGWAEQKVQQRCSGARAGPSAAGCGPCSCFTQNVPLMCGWPYPCSTR